MSTTTNTPPTHEDADFGDVMGPKADGCIQLRGGNIDTFHTIKFNNEKGNLLRAFIRENELDGFFGQESSLNWDLMPWLGCLDAILQTENHMKTTAAHNVHHKVNRQQWGGTFAATFGELATWVSEMGKDETGLGRWSWMLCKGLDGHAVCIIMAYNPNPTHTKTKTIYCQHQSYFESHGNFTCLRKASLCDFELKLWQWQSTGEKLIVFIDMNEDSLKGNIDAMLGLDGLEMTEVVCSTHPELLVPPTFRCSDRCGCHAVDGCYATPDL